MFCKKYGANKNLVEVRELLLQLNFLCPLDMFLASDINQPSNHNKDSVIQ